MRSFRRGSRYGEERETWRNEGARCPLSRGDEKKRAEEGKGIFAGLMGEMGFLEENKNILVERVVGSNRKFGIFDHS